MSLHSEDSSSRPLDSAASSSMNEHLRLSDDSFPFLARASCKRTLPPEERRLRLCPSCFSNCLLLSAELSSSVSIIPSLAVVVYRAQKVSTHIQLS